MFPTRITINVRLPFPALPTDPRSNLAAAPNKHRIDLPDHPRAVIFAAGDCRRGQSLVVWAIHEDRAAAGEIDRDLMGTTSLP